MDISSILMTQGVVYLDVVIDWYCCRVPVWRVSISIDTKMFTNGVKEAIAQYGTPKLLHTSQGSEGIFNRSWQY